MRQIRDRYADEIRRRFPRIPRRVSGYNLDELLPERGFQVARALVGAEGTLATVVSATLDLMHSPPCRRLAVLGFPDAFLAADAVPEVIRHEPIGLEGIDAMLLDFMQRKHLAEEEVKLLPPGGAFLLAEFGAESDAEAEAKARALIATAPKLPGSPVGRLCSPDEAVRIWRVRESALGATVFVPGEPHGWEGWEDAAVPPEQLGSYLRQLFGLMGEFGYRSPMYGHFGQGCVHTRINFDLESEAGIRKFREFIDRAADIVIAHGGSLSGEHGDGQARGALLPKMFGPELMQAFREFKALWDPDNRMNPGKMIAPDRRVSAGGESAAGRGVCIKAAGDLLSVSRRSWIAAGGDAALRGRGRLPQRERRNHVPQLHGHARRAALHAGPRPPAVGADAGRGAGFRLAQRRRARGAGSVPVVQGLQERVPGERGRRDL